MEDCSVVDSTVERELPREISPVPVVESQSSLPSCYNGDYICLFLLFGCSFGLFCCS